MNNEEEYTMLRQMVDQTSYVFDHDDNSNLTGIFEVLNHANYDQREQLKNIFDWQQLDNAQGKVLDMIGQDYGVNRIDNDDDFYRFLIRLAKIKNHTDGSIDSLYNLIAYALQADTSEFHIRLGYEINGEPNAIRVDNVLNKYNNDPRKTRLLMLYLSESIAAGIRLIGLSFQEINNNDLFVTGYSRAFIKYKVPSDIDVLDKNYNVDSDIKVNATQVVKTTYEISEGGD